MKEIKNKSASIKAKLLDISKSRGIDFDALLLRYLQERFLHRLMLSKFSDKFILKGGLLLICFKMPLSRPTKDVDLLAKGVKNAGRLLEDVFKNIACLSYDDGVDFIPSSVTSERIIENTDYKGIRIKIDAELGKAKKRLQFDIGFGDSIWPAANIIEFPTLLEDDPFRINVYSIESVIAEKFEIMLKLEMINSRMKDFFDIYNISRTFDFQGDVLKEAIEKTLERRQTSMPDIPVVLRKEFHENKDKQHQWTAFLRKIRMSSVEQDFSKIMNGITDFLKPVVISIIEKRKILNQWYSGEGVWK
jgi:predicted nucleotidyltransferase component of viral defense system